MPDLDTDLTRETDQVLDGLLVRLYDEHRGAEGEHKAEVHEMIRLLLAEFSRRLDVWLDGVRSA